MNNKEELARIQVPVNIKDGLKSVAASKHTTLQALTRQILSNFLDARKQLLQGGE